MKKRTIGRIAALGLAGLTSIPVVAMTASADITYTDKKDKDTELPIITGTASKVTWKITETTHNLGYFSNYELADDATVTEVDASQINTLTRTIGNYSNQPLQAIRYYSNSVGTDYDINAIKDAVKSAHETYTKTLNDYKAALSDYKFYMTYKDSVGQTTNLSGSHTNADGSKVYFGLVGEGDAKALAFYEYKTVDGKQEISQLSTYSVAEPQPVTGAKDYSFSASPVKTSISTAALINELGTNAVVINNGMIEVKPAASSTGYILSATGSNATTPGTSTGNYSQYEIPSLYRYASNTSYYSYDTDTWYPNTASFREAVGYYPNSSYSGYWTSKTPTYKYSSSRRWFDPTDGNYYTASGGSGYTVLVSANTDYDNTENYVYRSSTTGLYYLTWTAANNATNSNGTVEPIRSIPTYATYFSMTTGQFYSTYAAAYSASGNNASRVVALNGASTNVTGVDYLDPFYYYYMNGTSLRPTTNKDTSSVTIGNRKGWTNVEAYARSAKSGSSYNVSMNGETVIPSTVLSAIKGKNVTMNFTLKNGAVFSINGNDVSSAKDLDIDTAYNTKNIPSKLVSKAKSKYDGVSTSQLSIDGGSFGSSAAMTVKFSTKRAGCTARLYRYNADRNSLSLVSKSSVGSNGKCTFDDVTKGGDYVVVLS